MKSSLSLLAAAALVVACQRVPEPTGGGNLGGGTPAAAGRIGQMAPEISGNDLDGVAFKLSDYRGKVVMLDFWGDW